MTFETQYLDLLETLLKSGNRKGDRTGTGTRSLFARQIRVNLQEEFPLPNTKKVPFKVVAGELLWMLSGSTSAKYLREKFGVTIWDEWQDEDGELGPVYGAQWRNWRFPSGWSVDQIAEVIENIKKRPNSRRHVVSAWNPADLPDESISPQANVANGKMALSPCHCLFQFYVNDGNLSCHLYQRSCDIFLGVPFNLASYALLTHIIAKLCGLGASELVWTGGDVHLYENHIDQATEQLSRPVSPKRAQLIWNREPKDLDDVGLDCFDTIGYEPLAAIRAQVAI